ncbi:histidine phosphatase family protein [Parendozoicomonas sp. Alg238-R29]|uniref:histidine phosphatase family protein n=1 Tax=Parendozoicomonas sp. Alg238-R29 TaxID=2993446 RepID=UPI00248E0082|nr:histidine phosphatase family protein [Parendozoicomonas sp. Alg238-R29]
MRVRPAWLRIVVLAFVIPTAFSASVRARSDNGEVANGEVNRVFLIRHAQSLGNQTQSYSTHPANPSYYPAPLTDKGREQAKALGTELTGAGVGERNVAFIISSPLPRAIQTAQIVAKVINLPSDRILMDDRLIERNLGLRDGQPYNNFSGDHWYPDNPESFDGETSEQIRARMVAVWEKAVSLSENGHVLLVSHGQPIHSLTEALTGASHRINNARYVELFRDGSKVNSD